MNKKSKKPKRSKNADKLLAKIRKLKPLSKKDATMELVRHFAIDLVELRKFAKGAYELPKDDAELVIGMLLLLAGIFREVCRPEEFVQVAVHAPRFIR